MSYKYTVDPADGALDGAQGHSFMTRSLRCAKRDIDKLRSNLGRPRHPQGRLDDFDGYEMQFSHYVINAV